MLENTELSTAIRVEYSLGHYDLPSELRYILADPKNTVLSYGVWRKRTWLADVHAARMMGLRRRQSRPQDHPAISLWLR